MPKRLFAKWAMAVVAEHREPDMPIVATTGGLAQGAPWRVTREQEAILTRLRDLTRGYGRGSWGLRRIGPGAGSGARTDPSLAGVAW